MICPSCSSMKTFFLLFIVNTTETFLLYQSKLTTFPLLIFSVEKKKILTFLFHAYFCLMKKLYIKYTVVDLFFENGFLRAI